MDNKLLQKMFAMHGFFPKLQTPGLWLHDTRPIQFTLMVYDLEIEYDRKEGSHFLLDALNKNYKYVLEDW